MSTDIVVRLQEDQPFDMPTDLAEDAADFTLDSTQVEQGRQAVERCLDSLRERDVRRTTEEILDTLALLISGGVCDAHGFPWQQLRSYHGAAALALLREPGTPSRLESFRFRRDPARKYRQVPERYAPRYVQKARHALRRVIRECHSLGYLTEEEYERAIDASKVRTKLARGGRVLTLGEFRALTSVCGADRSPLGSRDALMLHLGYRGGLLGNEIAAANLDDLHFDSKKGQLTLRVRRAKNRRARSVPLLNGALIALEDWLELRDREDGPLLCEVQRGRIESRRLTAAAIGKRCRVRAEQAGVELFSANDLGRSYKPVPNGRKNGKSVREVATASGALYGAPAEESGRQALKVHFPYPRRSELLG